MDELRVLLGDGEYAELVDLADATGREPRTVVVEAVREQLRLERARAAEAAGRLARLHAPLLKRLGE